MEISCFFSLWRNRNADRKDGSFEKMKNGIIRRMTALLLMVVCVITATPEALLTTYADEMQVTEVLEQTESVKLHFIPNLNLKLFLKSFLCFLTFILRFHHIIPKKCSVYYSVHQS